MNFPPSNVDLFLQRQRRKQVSIVGRIRCFFGSHDFRFTEFRLNCLYFCSRGCGKEYFDRSIEDLQKMPPIDDDRLEEIHREQQR